MQPSQTHPNGYLVVACCRFSPKTILRILYGQKCLGFCATKTCADWTLRHSLLLLSSLLSVVRSYFFDITTNRRACPALLFLTQPWKGQHQNNCGVGTNHFARFGILESNCASAAWYEQSYSIDMKCIDGQGPKPFLNIGIPLKKKRLKHPRINHQTDMVNFHILSKVQI